MKKRFILLAGANKSGTSSVFEYLAAHPDCVASRMKETRFFLSQDYDVRSHSVIPYDGKMSSYLQFFDNNTVGDKYVEASPDYLYSSGTAQRIAKFFQDHSIQLIFILREPVSRFISYYHFSKQIGNIEIDMTFSEYIQRNLSEEYLTNSYQALKTGNYANYLREYYNLFPENNIHIFFFEDLKNDPLSFMEKVSNSLGLSKSFYENYEFRHVNKTQKVKNQSLNNIYFKLKKAILPYMQTNSTVNRILTPIKNVVLPLYKKVNMENSEKEVIAEKDILFLQKFYEKGNSELRMLLECKYEVIWE